MEIAIKNGKLNKNVYRGQELNDLDLLLKICDKIGADFKLTGNKDSFNLVVIPSQDTIISVQNLNRELLTRELFRIGTLFGLDL